MGSILSVLFGIILLPLYLGVGAVLAFLEWIYRGGPWVIYAFFPVIEYWNDRHIYPFTPVYLFIRNIIDDFENAVNIAQNAKIPIKRRWVWRRFWDVLSDPTAGCLTGITTGTLLIPLLRHLPFNIFVNIPQTHTSTMSWVLASVFVVFAGILLQAAMDGALLANEARAGMRIRRRLQQHVAGHIVLTETKLENIVPRDILDSDFFRQMFAKTLYSSYGPSIDIKIHPTQTSMPAWPRIFSIQVTAKGKQEGIKRPLESYAFMSALGEQFVFLEGPIVPSFVWHRFNVLHECGHLRNPGRAFYLKGRNEWCFATVNVVLITLLICNLDQYPLTYLRWMIMVAWLYPFYQLAKWKLWTSDIFVELTADLYAIANLPAGDIARATTLRAEQLLDRVDKSPRLGVRLAATLRLRLLRDSCRKCLANPVAWRRMSADPPYQFRSVDFAFNVCIMVLAAWFAPGLWAVAIIFVISLIRHTQTAVLLSRSKVSNLDVGNYLKPVEQGKRT